MFVGSVVSLWICCGFGWLFCCLRVVGLFLICFGCGLGLPTWNLFGLRCLLFVLVSCCVASLWFCLMLGLAAVFVFFDALCVFVFRCVVGA